MPSWITKDHRCGACGHTETVLHDRADETHTVSCSVCGSPAAQILTANITQASYVDGNGRFAATKEHRKLVREQRKAKRTGKKDDAKRLAREITIHKG